jgi:SAM-dependent methyltransferase
MPIANAQSSPESAAAGYDGVVEYFDRFAAEEDRWVSRTRGYHDGVARIYRSLIPRGQRVLEIGCGRGDLLAGLEPSHGVGVDVSGAMVAAARDRHPGLEFVHGAGESLQRNETFDYVVLSDVVPYAHDLQALLAVVAAHSYPGTRVVSNVWSNLWRPALALMALAGLRPSRPIRNWVSPRDLRNLFELAGFEPVSERRELVLPAPLPKIATLANGFLARLPGLRHLALTYWLVARPAAAPRQDSGVSVIVPCRNEAGKIDEIVERVPEIGTGTELIFVEGHSSDDTRARIEQAVADGDRDMGLIVQSGEGKGNAVREGFAAARHPVLMILDADLTVGPEDLPKFYDALVTGRGELVVGSRLVYGMEAGAMRFLNMLGNRFFAGVLTWVLGQYVKDALCGTKVLYREDYERIMARRHEFEEEDPFGDFELLLGAAALGLKILNIPVRYGARTYGETNIQRFSHGGMLARLAVAGFRRIWIKPVEL